MNSSFPARCLSAMCVAALFAFSPLARADHDHGHDHGHGDFHDDHHDHGHDHGFFGHGFYGPRGHFGFGYYPYYGWPDYYYGGPYYRSYYYDDPYYAYPPPRVYRGVALTGDELVIDVQRSLRRRGYYRGTLDGAAGPGTRAAIRAYQADHRLAVTGRLDGHLLHSLGVD